MADGGRAEGRDARDVQFDSCLPPSALCHPPSAICHPPSAISTAATSEAAINEAAIERRPQARYVLIQQPKPFRAARGRPGRREK